MSLSIRFRGHVHHLDEQLRAWTSETDADGANELTDAMDPCGPADGEDVVKWALFQVRRIWPDIAVEEIT